MMLIRRGLMLKFALHLPDCWNLLDVVTVVSLLAFILIMCPPPTATKITTRCKCK